MTNPSAIPERDTNQPWATSGPALVMYIAAAKLLLHFLTATRYGYFGDEMYHMACGEHLAWGYVDQPPLIALIAWITRHLLGTSLFAIHFFPAVAGAALVWLAGKLTRELGGGRFAQALSALCVACAPIYLVMHHLFTMNAFEPLIWMGCAHVVIRIVKTGNQKLWLWFGLLSGLGLENKYSMAIFGFGVVVGLLFTSQRKALLSKWIWIAGVIAFLIFLPNLLWNIHHHWPFLELMRNIRASGRDVQLSPLGYIASQIFLMLPAAAPVWIIGVLYFFLWKTGKPFRVLGWTFLTVLTVFIVLHGKDYYSTPVYPIVFAGGAIAIEQFSSRKFAWVKPASVAVIILMAVALSPLVVPLLSPPNLVPYIAKIPFFPKPDEKSMSAEPLPHYFSWSFGWEEMVAGVAKGYYSLPPDERRDTAIFGSDFAEAGAVDILGPKYGLPKAIGGHQSYWLWGPRNYSGQTMIVLGNTAEGTRHWFEEVTVIAELHHPYAAPWENRPVLLCRKPKSQLSLREVWPRLKNWD